MQMDDVSRAKGRMKVVQRDGTRAIGHTTSAAPRGGPRQGREALFAHH